MSFLERVDGFGIFPVLSRACASSKQRVGIAGPVELGTTEDV